MSTSVTYTVAGMTCQHCVDAVTSEIGRLRGVEQVTVDLSAGSVQVVSAGPLAPDAVRSAIVDAGYDLAAGPS